MVATGHASVAKCSLLIFVTEGIKQPDPHLVFTPPLAYVVAVFFLLLHPYTASTTCSNTKIAEEGGLVSLYITLRFKLGRKRHWDKLKEPTA